MRPLLSAHGSMNRALHRLARIAKCSPCLRTIWHVALDQTSALANLATGECSWLGGHESMPFIWRLLPELRTPLAGSFPLERWKWSRMTL